MNQIESYPYQISDSDLSAESSQRGDHGEKEDGKLTEKQSIGILLRGLRRIQFLRKADPEGRVQEEAMKLEMSKPLQIEMNFSFIKFF